MGKYFVFDIESYFILSKKIHRKKVVAQRWAKRMELNMWNEEYHLNIYNW